MFHLLAAIAMVCRVLGEFKEKSGIALTTRSSELGQVKGCGRMKEVGVVDLYTSLNCPTFTNENVTAISLNPHKRQMKAIQF